MTDETDVRHWEQKAEGLGITPGPGRAAWVLSQWSGHTDGQTVRFTGRYSSPYRCDDCGTERSGHGPVEVMIPDDSAESDAAGVLAGPFCPGCAVERVRRGYKR